MILIKSETTNSVNDDEYVDWHIANDSTEYDTIVNDIAKSIYDWNYNTDGAMSYRYNSITKYELSNIGDITLNDLKDIPIKYLKMILECNTK